ncbi:hypothetical protein HMPREF3229_00675 [Peptoniphilus harei]|uniref:Uncharacterized protein n=1 Tax=Peptoniphilus harei TaxID=54005 RepID=A0A133PR17_9FIRM|nr:hypothetical protein [Peptoniphilus harei]KXA31075.1 hypothetical protein HMPREF3229_00675 [Peptoniphilus harei]MDU6031800.1 hypothetical protein [Peptoniphilus harei]
MKDKTLNKAARYIIFRDMEVIVNTGLLIFISFAYLLGIYKLLLRARGEDFIILMTYAFVLGFGILGSNTILVKLSLRDKLSGRLEFLLGTGLDVKEIIKAYSIENWRLSSLPSFVIFFGTYLICDLGKSFVALYLSCIILHYFLILTLNVIAMYRKNFKFFKNLIYFSTSLLIYLFGVFSKKIILIFERQNLDVNIFILGINIFATIVLAAYSFYQIKKMDNESVMEVKSVWS